MRANPVIPGSLASNPAWVNGESESNQEKKPNQQKNIQNQNTNMFLKAKRKKKTYGSVIFLPTAFK